MTLTGHLIDYPLPDLVEILRHRGETGYLEVAYPETPIQFYFEDGKLMDARIGDPLNRMGGAEAINLALALPSAPFTFNPSAESSLSAADKLSQDKAADGRSSLGKDGPLTMVTAARPLSLLPGALVNRTTMSLWEENRLARVASALLICALAAAVFALWLTENRKVENYSASIPPVIDISPTIPPRLEAPAALSDGAYDEAGGAPADARPAELGRAAARARRNAPRPSRHAGQVENNSLPRSENLSPAPVGPNASIAQTVKARSGVSAAPTGPQVVPVTVRVDAEGRVTQAFVERPRPGMKAYEATAVRVARQRLYQSSKSGLEKVAITVDRP